MGIYSEKDEKLDSFVSRAYEALLKAGYIVNPDTFSEIPYGVGFKAGKSTYKKPESVTIYHSEKKGFSIVTHNAGIRALLSALLTLKDQAGSDEAGKGDFFGPLVVCAFYADPGDTEIFGQKLTDSKGQSGKAVFEFFDFVKRKKTHNYSVVRIMPKRYNTLFADMQSQGKNTNHMLAWAHRKALSELDKKKKRKISSVVVDKFTSNIGLLNNIAGSIPDADWHFEHRAEKNPLVAGASMIARAEYLLSLKSLSRDFFSGNIELCSGSGVKAEGVLKEIAKHYPDNVLEHICKMNFKTLKKVLKN
ncbi:MAG: ribonuclease HIII [bacterium]